MSGPLIVAFDCATDAGCVAALEPADGGGFTVVGSVRDEAGARHGGGVLLPLLAKVLAEAEAAQEDIAALVVGTGPGTFTGVRIAVSTGRALALSLGCPVFGVSTLDAAAAQALCVLDDKAQETALVVPVIDARRRQVFAAGYVPAAGGRVRGPILAVAPAEAVGAVAGAPGKRAVVTGSPTLLEGIAGQGVTLLPQLLDAAYLVLGQDRLAGGHVLWERLAQACSPNADRMTHALAGAGGPGSPEAVKPIYVRPPDADIHIKKMKDPWSGR